MPEQHLVANLAELAPGEIKQVSAGATDVLLINLANIIHAVEPLCPHYKQPLADGLVCGNILRCGWHQSVFDIPTGHVCEPPALDDLKKYPVRVDGSDIYVEIVSRQAARQRFVIVGGGAAGFCAAVTLRQHGYTGELLLLSSDSDAPYDRPNLSKDFLAGKPLDTPLPLRDESFYKTNEIDLRLNVTVGSIDRVGRAVVLAGGSTIQFDSLLIATGSRPRGLLVPGSELAGIHKLRSLGDAMRLIADAEHCKHVTIVGGSFIAMEAAAALQQRGLTIKVVLRGHQPLARILGDDIGRMIRTLHESKGVEFQAGQVARFEGASRVRSAVLQDGTIIKSDLILVAIGVDPATDFLRSSMMEFLHGDGGVCVDSHLNVCDKIYAAGDIARLPLNGSAVRIEHWRFAEQLGKIAAMNMLGIDTVYSETPYFWTYQYDLGLDYIGYATQWDEIIVDGNIDACDFTACFVQSNLITAVCCGGRSVQASAVMELMNRHRMPTLASIRGSGFDFAAELQKCRESDEAADLPCPVNPRG